jgi:hypothetical protein
LFAIRIASSPVNGSDNDVVVLSVGEGGTEDAVVDGEVTDVSVSGSIVDFGAQLLNISDKKSNPDIRATLILSCFLGVMSLRGNYLHLPGMK